MFEFIVNTSLLLSSHILMYILIKNPKKFTDCNGH